jgi:hypothetical protein
MTIVDEWNLSSAKLDEFVLSQRSHEAMFTKVGRAEALLSQPVSSSYQIASANGLTYSPSSRVIDGTSRTWSYAS